MHKLFKTGEVYATRAYCKDVLDATTFKYFLRAHPDLTKKDWKARIKVSKNRQSEWGLYLRHRNRMDEWNYKIPERKSQNSPLKHNTLQAVGAPLTMGLMKASVGSVDMQAFRLVSLSDRIKE